MAKEKHINTINYSEVHFFYPLCFDTLFSFEELCAKIAASSIIFGEDKLELLENGLNNAIIDIAEDMKQDPNLTEYINSLNLPTASESYKELYPEDLRVEIIDDSPNSRIRYSSFELNICKELFATIEGYAQPQKKIYGDFFKESHKHFILTPFYAELENGEDILITSHLFIFSNNCGVLKIELPLYNVSTTPLMEYDLNLYIKKILNRWDLNFFSDSCTIEKLYKVFLDNLHNEASINFYYTGDGFRNIILTEYENMPNDFSKIQPATAMDLFRIVSAPIQLNGSEYFKTHAREYMKKYQWSLGYIKYFMKTTGGCLSILDSITLNDLQEKTAVYICNKEHPSKELLVRYRTLTNVISHNTDFALIVVSLEKAVKSLSYFTKKYKIVELQDAQKRYNEDLMFLCDIQADCYGSVSEQIAAFKSLMPHYFKPELTEQRLKAIDDNLRAEQEQNQNRLNSMITRIGLLLTIILGLPAITEGLTIIRDLIPHSDIAHISPYNLGVLGWLILLLYIRHLFKKSRQKE